MISENILDSCLNEMENFNPDTNVSDIVDHIENEDRVVFLAADWAEKINDKVVTIIGCGGIGSHAAFNIARLKPHRINLVDFDTVEFRNMGGQLYSRTMVGQQKVNALGNIIHAYSGCLVNSFNSSAENMSSRVFEADFVICAVDNMEARSMVFEKWVTCGSSNSVFIDGRLAAEDYQIFTIEHEDVNARCEYRDKYLFPSEEAEETQCSYRQTTYCASLIGAHIANIVVNSICNQIMEWSRIARFKTVYNARTMEFKTEDYGSDIRQDQETDQQ